MRDYGTDVRVVDTGNNWGIQGALRFMEAESYMTFATFFEKGRPTEGMYMTIRPSAASTSSTEDPAHQATVSILRTPVCP